MDTHRTPAYEYLTQHRTKDAGYTHTCLTGGTFCVQGDDADRLDDLLAKAIRHDRPGEPSLPCLTQRRTMVFPLYLDLDLKLPERALADDLVRRLAATLATAVMRFWPDADDPAAFECVVCTRTGDAAQDDGGLYKHGLHVHWHNVLVDDNMARQVREGLLLDVRHDARLAALNAAHPVKWEDVLDASVYGPKGSLRLLGCPKATKCRSCGGRANESCGVCYRSNGCHLIDPRVYALRTALRGADECADVGADGLAIEPGADDLADDRTYRSSDDRPDARAQPTADERAYRYSDDRAADRPSVERADRLACADEPLVPGKPHRLLRFCRRDDA